MWSALISSFFISVLALIDRFYIERILSTKLRTAYWLSLYLIVVFIFIIIWICDCYAITKLEKISDNPYDELIFWTPAIFWGHIFAIFLLTVFSFIGLFIGLFLDNRFVKQKDLNENKQKVQTVETKLKTSISVTEKKSLNENQKNNFSVLLMWKLGKVKQKLQF